MPISAKMPLLWESVVVLDVEVLGLRGDPTGLWGIPVRFLGLLSKVTLGIFQRLKTKTKTTPPKSEWRV